MPEVKLMDYDVVEARYIAGHVMWLRFRDGTSGEIDLAPALRGPIFEPLRDPAVFSQFLIHPEFHTLVWPNGADSAPEFLHDSVRVITGERSRHIASDNLQPKFRLRLLKDRYEHGMAAALKPPRPSRIHRALFSILAQLSRSATVRLNTRLSGLLSGSTEK